MVIINHVPFNKTYLYTSGQKLVNSPFKGGEGGVEERKVFLTRYMTSIILLDLAYDT